MTSCWCLVLLRSGLATRPSAATCLPLRTPGTATRKRNPWRFNSNVRNAVSSSRRPMVRRENRRSVPNAERLFVFRVHPLKLLRRRNARNQPPNSQHEFSNLPFRQVCRRRLPMTLSRGSQRDRQLEQVSRLRPQLNRRTPTRSRSLAHPLPIRRRALSIPFAFLRSV